MSTLKIDGDWITLDDRRVARLVDDLPHWLMVELRGHEGSPEAHRRAGEEAAGNATDAALNAAYDDGVAAGRADALRDEIGA